MSRPLRIEYPGAIYHLTSRGNARLPIFEDDNDRRTYLNVLEDVVKRYNWLCHAYCLMDNHYHLIIETPDANLSVGMRQLNGVYTQKYNRKHDRAGHIFQGRFKSILVERDSHLLELCRYVVLNPVRAGMTNHPAKHKWSSYKATTGMVKSPALLQTDWILRQFGKKRNAARKKYRLFVLSGMDEKSPWEELKAQCILGSQAFVDKLKPALKEKTTIAEIPKTQRFAYRVPLEKLFPFHTLKNKENRDISIRKAYFENGYSLSEISKHIGLHYTTISKIVNVKN